MPEITECLSTAPGYRSNHRAASVLERRDPPLDTLEHLVEIAAA